MSSEDNGARTGLEIGRTLELARKERGLSFKEVEEATKIRAGYLEELERENFDVLPAVYMQGSLKTYANFLGLDGEALVQQLKRRQTSQLEPTYVEPQEDASDLPTIPLGTSAVVGSREAIEDEEDAGGTSFPTGINRYLYLSVGAFLVLVAVILAFTLAGDREPAVSQVREPLISQAPPEASPVSSEKVERALQRQRNYHKQDTDNKDNVPQLQPPAGSPDEKAKNDEVASQTAQTGQDQDDSRSAQDPRDATATPSASPTAETAPSTAEPVSTATHSAPTPARAPVRDGQGVVINTRTDGMVSSQAMCLGASTWCSATASTWAVKP